MALAEVIRLHARTRPNHAAIVSGDHTISYAALDRMVNGLCFRLAAHGIARGDFAGVALGDNATHLITLLAMARLGAVIVPLDHRWSDGEKLAVASRFAAVRVLVDPDAAAPREAPWLHLPPHWLDETDAVYRDPEVTSESPLLLSLSSGTTGEPKGPLATHRQFESRFMTYWLNLGFTSYERYLSAMPLYFGAGRGFTWSMLFAGATAALFPPPYAPEQLIEYASRMRATAMFLVPTILRRLLEVNHDGLAFPTLQSLVASGSALFPDERRAIKRRLTPHLYEMYSSTEGGAVSVLGPQDVERYPDSVGRPCFRVQVEIVDEEHRPLPVGETGRLRYRSPASAQAYYRGDSSEAFRDGWYYPGDLAAINQDGFVFLKGRIKDMIIRGGVNIFPGDIEQVLMRTGRLREAVVVGMPSRQYGEEIAAFVVAARPSGEAGMAAQPVDETVLLAACRAALAPYKVPTRIVFLDALPKHSGGKVLKAELVKLLAAGAD
jgi:acyl-CoA synthetase (AMP-forming)/AMP-acid ligase II